MARQLQIEYEGTNYHVIRSGDRHEIVLEDNDDDYLDRK